MNRHPAKFGGHRFVVGRTEKWIGRIRANRCNERHGYGCHVKPVHKAILTTKGLTTHARISYSRFVKTLGFSVLPGGTWQRRKLRPEMSSHHEKSAKAKTMKGN